MERKPLSKRLRFEVFKRDLFACQYCGQKPPAVVLEVDHIVPVVEGGSSDEHNLITACFDCNRGKAAGNLVASPIDVGGRRLLLQERLEQTEAYEALLSEERAILDEGVDRIIEIYELAFPGWTVADRVRPSIRRFLEICLSGLHIQRQGLA